MSKDLFFGYTPVASGNQVYLDRPRINRLLEKATQKPLVSVVAGAGYGKTQAVYAFAKKLNVRTAWMQITEQDNESECFWENYIFALSVINRESVKKLGKMKFPAGPEQFEQYLRVVKQEVIPNERYLLVYDDFELIRDNKVLCFLGNALAATFPNISSILISRTEPALNLTSHVSRKLVFRVTEEDLRFSRDEMVSYFRLQHITPAPSMSLAIYNNTEGWAFAIHMAGLSLKNSYTGTAYFPQALRSNTFKLFESEIMADVSPDFKRFLVKLSLIENPGRDLPRELLRDLRRESGKDNSVIKKLEEINSFIRYDSKRNSYHIHTLFLEYLRDLQNDLSEAEKTDIWNKTALWYAANDHKMDAIIYFEKAGNYTGIIDLFNTLPGILPNYIASFIIEILDRAPKNIYGEYPMLAMIRARALISLSRYEQSRKELLDFFPVLDSMRECPEKDLAFVYYYMNLGFLGFLLAPYTGCFKFTCFFRKAAAFAKKSGYVAAPPLNGLNLGFHACRITEASPEKIKQFTDAVEKMVPRAASAMGGCQWGLRELVYGELAFFRGSLAEARKYLSDAREKAREKKQYEIENRALFYLLRICLCRGNSNGAKEVLKQINAELEETYYPNRYFHHDIVTGWYYIQTGRKDNIAPWLKSDYTESGLNSRAFGLEKLVKAKYFFAEKRYPAALASLENRADMEIFLIGNIEMKALEAICRYRQGDRRGAFEALAEAYRLAVPSGLFTPFTELGKDMRSLAEAALRENPPGLENEWLEQTRRQAAIYAKKLYLLTGQSGQGEGTCLSRREAEVLAGLSRGLTREEIAGAESISPNTVKSVTRSIYNKLGARNQADAVRIATEKGIL